MGGFIGCCGSGSGGGNLTVTDGTNTVSGTTQVTFNGATVGGATPNATVTVSTGALTKISEQILSGVAATVSFLSIPNTFRNLILTIAATATTKSNQAVTLQFNADAGANYDWSSFAFGTATGNSSALNDTSCTVGNVADSTSNAASVWYARIALNDYASTAFWKSYTGFTNRRDNGSIFTDAIGGFWHNTGALSSILITLASSTFVAGSVFTLYGES
jgi:hypothetical protein